MTEFYQWASTHFVEFLAVTGVGVGGIAFLIYVWRGEA